MLMFYRVGNGDGEGTVLSGHHLRLKAVLSRDPRAGSRCSFSATVGGEVL